MDRPPPYLEPILQRLVEGDARMAELKLDIRKLQEALADSLAAQAAFQRSNQEILDVYKGFKATVRIFGIIERICLFITKVGGAAAILYGVWRFVLKESLERIVQ